AYALLRVPGTDSKILPGPNVEDPDKTFQKTQVALIKSRKTLQAALRDRLAQQVSFLRNVPDPVAWLEGELQVSFLEGTEIIRIALTESNPKEIADVVNAVKKAYLEETIRTERALKLTRLQEVENLCSKQDDKLLTQRGNLKKYVD